MKAYKIRNGIQLSILNSSSFPPGSSPALPMTLFVMCVACLAGTALMAFKKSRDKPVGYTVLATGDQE